MPLPLRPRFSNSEAFDRRGFLTPPERKGGRSPAKAGQECPAYRVRGVYLVNQDRRGFPTPPEKRRSPANAGPYKCGTRMSRLSDWVFQECPEYRMVLERPKRGTAHSNDRPRFSRTKTFDRRGFPTPPDRPCKCGTRMSRLSGEGRSPRLSKQGALPLTDGRGFPTTQLSIGGVFQPRRKGKEKPCKCGTRMSRLSDWGFPGMSRVSFGGVWPACRIGDSRASEARPIPGCARSVMLGAFLSRP